MEIDKHTDLDCVEDDFEEGAHGKLDEEIRQIFPHLPPKNLDLVLPLLLASIVEQSGSCLLTKYRNISECATIIKSEPRLRNMLLDGFKNSYKSVRLLSKDLSVSSDCTSDASIAELLRPSEYQPKISWKSYPHYDFEESVFKHDERFKYYTRCGVLSF